MCVKGDRFENNWYFLLLASFPQLLPNFTHLCLLSLIVSSVTLKCFAPLNKHTLYFFFLHFTVIQKSAQICKGTEGHKPHANTHIKSDVKAEVLPNGRRSYYMCTNNSVSDPRLVSVPSVIWSECELCIILCWVLI